MTKSSLSIMLVDDDEFLLKLLQRMLELKGFTAVTSYADGKRALRALDEKKPDIIFLDLNMPEMDGIEFVRHLVAKSFTGNLILVSGEDERLLQSAGRLVKTHGIGCLGILQKPLVPDAVSELLAQWKPPAIQPVGSSSVYTAEHLQQALERGELINYYQPKVALNSGQVVGVEALVRWQHPRDGLLLPVSFISLAEDSALIDQLAQRVLDLALQQITQWAQSGIHLPLAINLSMENLATLEFADTFSAQVAAAGVLAKDVTLEVTESRAMKNPAITLDTLTRLRLKRFILSIDDFGTGHSTLAHLRDIPFDEFKIDRSFVHRAWVDQRIKAMFENSLNLAKQLGMSVVAEGVETINDWNFLRKTTCDFAQGYFIAEPMPGDELPNWLNAWQKQVRTELIPEQAADTLPEKASAPSSAPTALIIEDHEFQRRVQSKILREENFNVVAAASGVEALNILRKLRPQLILIDIELPDIKGLEILRRLRSTSIFKHTPILMVSGNTNKEILEESRLGGANGFLAKPFDRKEFAEKVARLLKS